MQVKVAYVSNKLVGKQAFPLTEYVCNPGKKTRKWPNVFSMYCQTWNNSEWGLFEEDKSDMSHWRD